MSYERMGVSRDVCRVTFEERWRGMEKEKGDQ